MEEAKKRRRTPEKKGIEAQAAQDRGRRAREVHKMARRCNAQRNGSVFGSKRGRSTQSVQEGKDNPQKKTLEYRQKDEKKREEYLKQIETILEEKRIYIDESGIDSNIQRAYGRACRGQKVMGKIWGGKPPRTNFIAALKQQKLFAAYAFEGSLNSHRFNRPLSKLHGRSSRL